MIKYDFIEVQSRFLTLLINCSQKFGKKPKSFQFLKFEREQNEKILVE